MSMAAARPERVMHLAGDDALTPDYGSGSVFFVGAATVLIRYAGFTVLTDPNFLHAGDHVHLGYGLTAKRLTDPGLDVDQLPALDCCVLSHLSSDHFDRIAEACLDRDLPIVSTPQAAAALRRRGFRSAHGLRRWEAVRFHKGGAKLRVTAMPGQHGPRVLRYLMPPVMGSMLEFGSDGGEILLRLYISGDTLPHDDLREIPRRYPQIDIGLIHLGGARILGVLLTMDAERGIQALRIVQPDTAIPIHSNDYSVFKSPLQDFQRAAERAGWGDRIVYLHHGETYEFHVGERGHEVGAEHHPA
jgi:L-ascorbate metabolism protein UlaG (beta-lactamase superfamily)